MPLYYIESRCAGMWIPWTQTRSIRNALAVMRGIGTQVTVRVRRDDGVTVASITAGAA